jgi:hypothetical protein
VEAYNQVGIVRAKIYWGEDTEVVTAELLALVQFERFVIHITAEPEYPQSYVGKDIVFGTGLLSPFGVWLQLHSQLSTYFLSNLKSTKNVTLQVGSLRSSLFSSF